MIIFLIILSIIIIALVALYAIWYFAPIKYGQTNSYTIGDGKTLKIGVFSDMQLSPSKMIDKTDFDQKAFRRNMTKAFEEMKSQNVNMLICVGDICNQASFHAYKTYLKAIKSVWSDKDTRPLILNVMGNHDIYFPWEFKYEMVKQKIYMLSIKENPFVHKIVNGVHFIGASPELGGCAVCLKDKGMNWLKKELEIADKDTPKGKPIFLILHHAPKDTMYGSDENFAPGLYEILQSYPNVVAISGHTHYSIVDERAIMQKDFTSFSTQSLSYMELEPGRFNAFVENKPTFVAENLDVAMMLIMDVLNDKTVIHRFHVLKNEEEQKENPWTLKYPLEKENFEYTFENRKEKYHNPKFENNKINYVKEIKSPFRENKNLVLDGISFNSAKCDDLVHHYDVTFIDENKKEFSYSYFSDFYLGRLYQKDVVTLPIDKNLKKGEYDVVVVGVSSFGLKSDELKGHITKN